MKKERDEGGRDEGSKGGRKYIENFKSLVNRY